MSDAEAAEPYVLSILVMPAQVNTLGVMHGGPHDELDGHGRLGGRDPRGESPSRRVYFKAVDDCVWSAPVHAGEVCHVTARLAGVGTSSLRVELSARAEDPVRKRPATSAGPSSPWSPSRTGVAVPVRLHRRAAHDADAGIRPSTQRLDWPYPSRWRCTSDRAPRTSIQAPAGDRRPVARMPGQGDRRARAGGPRRGRPRRPPDRRSPCPRSGPSGPSRRGGGAPRRPASPRVSTSEGRVHADGRRPVAGMSPVGRRQRAVVGPGPVTSWATTPSPSRARWTVPCTSGMAVRHALAEREVGVGAPLDAPPVPAST